MEFSINEWRTFYDKVNELGAKLRDSKPTYTASGREIPPIRFLKKEAQDWIESQMKTLLQRSNHYLDQTGMKMPKPLWIYSNKDSSTWASSLSFKYRHLIDN